MTDTPERALLRRLVEARGHAHMSTNTFREEVEPIVREAAALLAAPESTVPKDKAGWTFNVAPQNPPAPDALDAAPEGEEYTVSGIVGNLVHIVMPDGFKPGDRVRVTRVAP